VLWLHVWKLDPIIHKIISYPEYSLVASFASQFLDRVSWLLLLDILSSLSNPVILFLAKNLSEKLKGSRSTQHSKPLD
jgi:hypothetical protein